MILQRCILLLVVSSYISLIRAQGLQNVSCCDRPICLEEAIHDITEKLSVGIQSNNQELTINPLRYSGPFVYHINISELYCEFVTTNNVFQGLAHSVVSDAQLSDVGSNTVISFKTWSPYVKHTADYTMVGVIKTLEGFDGEIVLNEHGVATFTYIDTEFHHEIILGTEYRNGKPVLRVRSHSVKLLQAVAFITTFSNLFGGKDILKAKAYHEFINKSSQKIFKQISPEINCAYTTAIGRLGGLLINGYPAEKFCPGRQTS